MNWQNRVHLIREICSFIRRLVVIKCHFDTPFFFILRTFFEFEKFIKILKIEQIATMIEQSDKIRVF